ncbi:hypothetical protein BJ742DRAFT_843661 [Cladochytrium replicatum]|nr:hypothetical protein BJ742DRAFT_843661 [Cladochytrium replicatum]
MPTSSVSWFISTLLVTQIATALFYANHVLGRTWHRLRGASAMRMADPKQRERLHVDVSQAPAMASIVQQSLLIVVIHGAGTVFDSSTMTSAKLGGVLWAVLSSTLLSSYTSHTLPFGLWAIDSLHLAMLLTLIFVSVHLQRTW